MGGRLSKKRRLSSASVRKKKKKAVNTLIHTKQAHTLSRELVSFKQSEQTARMQAESEQRR